MKCEDLSQRFRRAQASFALFSGAGAPECLADTVQR